MTQHRIMLFGSAGQIGQAIQHLSKKTGFPHNWELGLYSRPECDITNPAALRHAIQSFKPHLIINTAGITRIDEAQKNQEIAVAANFHAVAQMAAQCSTMDIPLIHISSDHVFDGEKTMPYFPDDDMDPINHFGVTRMMGEESIRHEMPWHVIVRTSSLFSPFRRNILTNALKAIETLDEIRVVTDRTNGPTSAIYLAKALAVIGTQILAGKTDGFGTFHLCGAPACSRFEFIEGVRAAYEPHTTRRPKLIPVTSAETANLAKRPAYSVLDCAKIEKVYGITQQPWREGVAEAIDILFKGGRTPRLPHSAEQTV